MRLSVRLAIVLTLSVLAAAALFVPSLRARVVPRVISRFPSDAALVQRASGVRAAPLRGDDPTVDWPALRQAAKYLGHEATYFIRTAPTSSSATSSDLRAAGYLLFLPALPVTNPSRAVWILSYHVNPILPPATTAIVTFHIADGLYVSKVTR
jgi:hypothetical protein